MAKSFPQSSIKEGKGLKNPYFTSVAQNCHLTNKPYVNSVLTLPPSLHQGSVLEVLKLQGKERSQKKDLRPQLGTELGTSCTEAHALTGQVLIILPQSKVLYWLSVNNNCCN